MFAWLAKGCCTFVRVVEGAERLRAAVEGCGVFAG